MKKCLIIIAGLPRYVDDIASIVMREQIINANPEYVFDIACSAENFHAMPGKFVNCSEQEHQRCGNVKYENDAAIEEAYRKVYSHLAQNFTFRISNIDYDDKVNKQRAFEIRILEILNDELYSNTKYDKYIFMRPDIVFANGSVSLDGVFASDNMHCILGQNERPRCMYSTRDWNFCYILGPESAQILKDTIQQFCIFQEVRKDALTQREVRWYQIIGEYCKPTNLGDVTLTSINLPVHFNGNILDPENSMPGGVGSSYYHHLLQNLYVKGKRLILGYENTYPIAILRRFINIQRNEPRTAKVVIDGGLGNKLFQIATLLGYCENSGKTPLFDARLHIRPAHEKQDWSYFVRELSNVSNDSNTSATTVTYQEKYLEFGKYYDLKSVIPQDKDVILKGYFQSEKYFNHIRPRILEQFRCPSQIRELITLQYPTIEKSAFLHVRRGDNIPSNTLHYFGEMKGYYNLAINHIRENAQNFENKWLVCSDDIEWCKKQEWIINLGDVTFVDENEIVTLWIMSLCGYGGIASNSSFSWWGLWLNESKDKVCVATEKVVNPDCYMDDYFPPFFKTFPNLA